MFKVIVHDTLEIVTSGGLGAALRHHHVVEIGRTVWLLTEV